MAMLMLVMLSYRAALWQHVCWPWPSEFETNTEQYEGEKRREKIYNLAPLLCRLFVVVVSYFCQ